MKLKIILLLLISLFVASSAGAADEVKMPSASERKSEENLLIKKISPLVKKKLGKNFTKLKVKIRHIVQAEAYSKDGKKVHKVKLPGFDHYTDLTLKDEVTVQHKLKSYRTLLLILKKKISQTAKKRLERLLTKKAGLDFKERDQIEVIILPESKSTKKSNTKKPQKFDPQRSPYKDIEPNLLTEGLGPHELDPVQEAKSAQRLIKARQAFFHNNLDKALIEVIEAIKISPRSSQAYEMLGSIYYRLNWKTLAYKSWYKALELNPENKKLSMHLNRLSRDL